MIYGNIAEICRAHKKNYRTVKKQIGDKYFIIPYVNKGKERKVYIDPDEMISYILLGKYNKGGKKVEDIES